MGATQEQNKAVVRRYITETDRGNLEIVFDVMTEDVRWHLGGTALDRDALLAGTKGPASGLQTGHPGRAPAAPIA